jgi:hypothetical protein
MNLIDRYVHEVGRHLPRQNRLDIQEELRSHIVDTLEGRYAKAAEAASESETADLLKEMGPPRKIAAQYAPQTQYLIGPALYPLFRMVAGIVLAAVLGAQLLAFGIAVWVANRPLDPWETLGGLLNSIPAVIGSLVIVFAILQWFDVRPDLEDEPWDPRTLPEIEEAEPVKRLDRIVGIAAASILLAVLFFFTDRIGVYNLPEGEVFTNPVIAQYLGWISLSLLAGIALDIYLLWQGRWTVAGRAARIAVNLLSIAVLALLLQGHNAWLAERGASGWLPGLAKLAENVQANWQVIGMQAFQLAFGIALVATAIETGFQAFRLLAYLLRGGRPRIVSRIHE